MSELKDDMVADLREFVELTEFGSRWAQRLAELDEPAAKEHP